MSWAGAKHYTTVGYINKLLAALSLQGGEGIGEFPGECGVAEAFAVSVL